MLKLPITAKEYYLIEPGEFQEKQSNIEAIPYDHTVLSPLATAICASDLQYYYGEKSPEKLAKRLPLILLHEGVCFDHLTGMRVVPVAGDFHKVPTEFINKENLWPDLPYMGATMHGLARSHLLYPKDLLIPAPVGLPDEIACLTEPVSIVFKAAKDMNLKFTDRVAIIGTGGIAYLLALVLRFYYNFPLDKISIFGINNSKLKYFKGLAGMYNYQDEENLDDFNAKFDAVFEVVGRNKIKETIKLAFNLIKPGGKIGVIGLSDLDMDLPSNKLVNQGISVVGLSRSTFIEYQLALNFLNQEVVQQLIKEKMVNKKLFLIDSIHKIKEAFEFAKQPEHYGRIMLKWPTNVST